jgi:hypothetical protein
MPTNERQRAARPETTALLGDVRTAADAAKMAESRIVDQLAYLLGFGDESAPLVSVNWHATGGKGSCHEMQRVAMDTALGLNPVPVRRVVCMDLYDRNRLFSCELSDLLAKPSQILGRGVSVAMMDEWSDVFKVMSYKRLPRQPEQVWTMTRTTIRDWYLLTYRAIDPASGNAKTVTRWEGFADTGESVPYRVRRWNERIENDPGQTVCVCSVIEDAYRNGAVRLTVEEGPISVTMPVAHGAHLDALSLREAPMGARDRRRAVLHKVREHLRVTSMERTEVKAHTRGVSEVVFGGMRIAIEVNTPEATP